MAEHPARVEEEVNPDDQLVSRGEFLAIKSQVQEMVTMMRSMAAATMPTLLAAVPPVAQVTPPIPAPVPVQPDLASTSAALPPVGNLPKTTNGPAPTAQVTLSAEDVKQYSNIATAGSMEDRLASQLASMEKSLREIRGIDLYGGTNYNDLCLFPKVQLPPKFKVPDFTKYDGTGCPYTHLRMFCGELGGVGNNKKLCIQLFQRSLKGSALLWYVGEYGRMKTWSELTSLFMS
uniref:Retrotransposon gag domain-containing protein n=1 Tax=Davidia involucrata TaxID=16924 RepID=A0A5B7AZE5_DAVIN